MNFPRQPLKLEECRLKGAGTELFLVEGDSAAQAVVRCRNADTQAVLPLQGKPLNAWKASENRVANFELFQILAEAIGGGWGEGFDLASVRYERIVLLFDPDADGIHCGALMTMYFYRWMKPLVEAERIFVVRAPLVEFTSRRLENPAYAFTEDDYERALDFFEQKKVTDFKARRFRGLASLDETTLVRTCVDPATRRISTTTTADALAAIEIFGTVGKPHE